MKHNGVSRVYFRDPGPPMDLPVWRIVGVAISLVCAVILGIQLSFTVYALPLKKTFNFTQTDGEL